VAGRAVAGLRWLPRSPPRRGTAAAGPLAGNRVQSLPRAAWIEKVTRKACLPKFKVQQNQAAAVFMSNIPMGKGIKPAQNT